MQSTTNQRRRADGAFNIVEWLPVRRGALLGFTKVELPSGMVIADVTVLTSERGPWASPPSKPILGPDGMSLKDDRGKTQYQPVIEFTSKDVRDRWSSVVIAALRETHPEVFQ